MAVKSRTLCGGAGARGFSQSDIANIIQMKENLHLIYSSWTGSCFTFPWYFISKYKLEGGLMKLMMVVVVLIAGLYWLSLPLLTDWFVQFYSLPLLLLLGWVSIKLFVENQQLKGYAYRDSLTDFIIGGMLKKLCFSIKKQ